MSQIIRKGVKSISKSGSPKLTDDVTLSEGSGVTITQSGQDIEIAASGGSGSGDVVGPASSTDNAIARFDGTDGKTIQNSSVTIDDTGMVTVTPVSGPDSGGITLQATTNGLFTGKINEASSGTGVTIDGVLIKDGEVDGVDVSALETTVGGKITGFADPNADRIVFWDDSAGAYAALTPSTGLTVSGTNMTVRTASASQTGIVELATTAETTTGTDATRAVTPDGLHDMTSLAGAAWFLDEDAMTSNDATKVPSQQSVKAYVDANAGGGGITWNEVTGTSQAASINNGYITNNAGLVTVTIPSTAAVGSVVRIAGKGAGGWKVAQNASEVIHFGDVDTTTGTGGSLASTNRYDAVELVCITANNDWVVASSVGNIEVV